jgi:hypothetical protein
VTGPSASFIRIGDIATEGKRRAAGYRDDGDKTAVKSRDLRHVAYC